MPERPSAGRGLSICRLLSALEPEAEDDLVPGG